MADGDGGDSSGGGDSGGGDSSSGGMGSGGESSGGESSGGESSGGESSGGESSGGESSGGESSSGESSSGESSSGESGSGESGSGGDTTASVSHSGDAGDGGNVGGEDGGDADGDGGEDGGGEVGDGGDGDGGEAADPGDPGGGGAAAGDTGSGGGDVSSAPGSSGAPADAAGGDVAESGGDDGAAPVGTSADPGTVDGPTTAAASSSAQVAGSDAPEGFSVSPAALSEVTSTLGGLVSDGQGLAARYGTTGLEPAVFGGFGAPVATAVQALGSNQLAALSGAFTGLGTVGDHIGVANLGYQDADQAVSTAFGGPYEGAVATTSPYGSLPDASVFGTSPYGSLPDASVFGAPATSLPTFMALSPEEQTAIDTLNAQDLQTAPLPTFAALSPDQQTAINTMTAQDLPTPAQAPAGLADDPTMQSQLITHEAAKPHVYTDTMGHPTVGIGFNLDRTGARDALSAVGADYGAVRAGTQDLSDAQMTQLAHTDTQHAVDVARGYYSGFDSLDPARQRTLVDMSFNLDSKMNQFTGLHQALVDGDYNAAADHIANSLFARQTGHRGTDLTNQMRNGGQ